MSRKGRHEGSLVGILCEVGLVIAKDGFGETVGNVVASCKLGYRKGLWEVGRVVEEGAKAFSGIENGAARPAEGEVSRSNAME